MSSVGGQIDVWKIHETVSHVDLYPRDGATKNVNRHEITCLPQQQAGPIGFVVLAGDLVVPGQSTVPAMCWLSPTRSAMLEG